MFRRIIVDPMETTPCFSVTLGNDYIKVTQNIDNHGLSAIDLEALFDRVFPKYFRHNESANIFDTRKILCLKVAGDSSQRSYSYRRSYSEFISIDGTYDKEINALLYPSGIWRLIARYIIRFCHILILIGCLLYWIPLSDQKIENLNY